MTDQRIKIKIQRIVKRATSRGLKIHKNNIDRARSIKIYLRHNKGLSSLFNS